jgi:hypothetical protein
MDQPAVRIIWWRIILGIVLIGLGIFIVIFQAGKYAIESFQSQAWPSTAGIITNSGVISIPRGASHGGGYSYHAHVSYSYELNNQSYSGNTVYFGCCDGSRDDQAAIAQHYPVNSKVEVYYDPTNPEISTLDRGFHFEPVIGIFLVGLMCCLVGLISLQGWKKKVWPSYRQSSA